MNISHINPMTNFPCPGVMLFSGMTFYGNEMCSVYRCSICGRTFFVNNYGNVVL